MYKYFMIDFMVMSTSVSVNEADRSFPIFLWDLEYEDADVGDNADSTYSILSVYNATQQIGMSAPHVLIIMVFSLL